MPLFYYLFHVRTIYDCSNKNLLVLKMRVNGECVSPGGSLVSRPTTATRSQMGLAPAQTTLSALKPEQRLYG
jgi:hypothetical protein